MYGEIVWGEENRILSEPEFFFFFELIFFGGREGREGKGRGTPKPTVGDKYKLGDQEGKEGKTLPGVYCYPDTIF